MSLYASITYNTLLAGPPQIHVPADIEESETTDPKASDSMPQQSSGNTMLLDDTLKNLSSEATPPEGTDGGAVPGSETSLSSSRSGGVSDVRKKFEMFGPTTRGARPPSREMKQPGQTSGDQSEGKNAFVKLKPTPGNGYIILFPIVHYVVCTLDTRRDLVSSICHCFRKL